MLRIATYRLKLIALRGLLISSSLILAACAGNSAISSSDHTIIFPTAPPSHESKQAETSQSASSRLKQGDDIKFARLSVEHGLSHSTVWCILQDSQGFIWFGTEDGLNKYDGYSFKVYRHEPDKLESISHNHVMSIVEGREGTIWIGTYGGGLNRFDPQTERIERFQANPDDPNSLSNNLIRNLYIDRAGTLWIATHGGGLDEFHPESGRFVHHQPDVNNPWSLQNWLFDTIYEDQEGALWIGSNERGLAKYDRSTGHFLHYQHDPDNPDSISADLILDAIIEDSQGKLWVGTVNGLNAFDRESEQFTHYYHNPDDPQSLSHNAINTIYEDRLGNLWIGTADGLNRYNRQSDNFTHYQNDPDDPTSLSSNFVRSIYEDQAGTLWIGTMGSGLNMSDPTIQRFKHYYHDYNNPNSLNNNIVNSIYEDQDGILWIGTWGGGLNRYDRDTGEWRNYKIGSKNPTNPPIDIVSAIYGGEQKALWVGTAFDGLYQFDRATEQFSLPQTDPINLEWLSTTGIRSLYLDSDGSLWIGTHGNGVHVLNSKDKQFRHYQHDPENPSSLSDDWVYTIYEDRNGMLWFGTRDGGLNRFDRSTERFTHYQHIPENPNSLSNNFVQAIYQDQDGTLWIGTEGGGLNKFDEKDNTFIRYGEREGLPSNSIFGILEDDQGFLWISTGNGLSKLDPRSETFKSYDIRDGLQSYVFVSGASYKSSRGEMFFGGINGFNAFYPDRIVDNRYIPPIMLTSLTQSGEPVDLNRAVEYLTEVTFRRPNNYFEFEFAALNYIQPEKNQYAYILEGYDKDWNYIGAKRVGQYDNLPVGTYQLRVKGSNNDGTWNDSGVSLKVTIVPQFWETWWFRGGLALLLVAVMLGSYQLRVRGLEARSRELEQKVTERTSYLEALYRAEEQMHRHLQLDQVLQALVDVAVDTLHAEKSAIFLWEEERERWAIKVARGFNPEAVNQLSFATGEGTVGQTAASAEPIFVANAPSDQLGEMERPEAIKAALSEGIQSFVHLPILIDGKTFAVFNVSFTELHAFEPDEQRLFLALAQRAAQAIENAWIYGQAQEFAAVEERQRLARDLHDAVTQTLFSTSLIAEVLPRVWEKNQEDGRQRLEQVRQATRSALAEMRTLLLELRPTGLAETDLADLLHQLAEAVQGRTRLSVTVDVQDEEEYPSPPTEVHIALYRIAQEALNNITKHARAKQVKLKLQREPDRITLSIIDDGRGFDHGNIPQGHFGIVIMKERAKEVGARLTIESQIEGGTQVTATWAAFDRRKED